MGSAAAVLGRSDPHYPNLVMVADAVNELGERSR